jgi:hypothetical protein
MTDAEYLFRQTEIERKRAGYGDRHKKRQGGRHVRLPSDHRTKKEIAAMSGEVKVYKERPFYTREELQALPDDLQVKWINSVIIRYDVSVRGLSTVVFDNHDWLRTYINSKGFSEYINKGPKGRAADKGIRALTAAYEAFKNGAETVDKQREPQEAELQAQEQETPANEPQGENTYTIRDECVKHAQENAEKIDVTRIAELLRALSGTGAKLTIEVVL